MYACIFAVYLITHLKIRRFNLDMRSHEKLFNIALIKSDRNREDLFVDSLLFADDVAFVASFAVELQSVVKRFSHVWSLFATSISQDASADPMILLDGTLLKVIDEFCYVGSTITNGLSLNTEFDFRKRLSCSGERDKQKFKEDSRKI